MNARTAAAFGVGLVVVLAAVWVWRRGFAGVAEDTARGAVGVVSGAAVGTVKGVGAAVGIPDTEMQKCRDALARKDYWNASFFCPAGTFVGSLFGSSPGGKPGAPNSGGFDFENFDRPPMVAELPDPEDISSHLSDF